MIMIIIIKQKITAQHLKLVVAFCCFHQIQLAACEQASSNSVASGSADSQGQANQALGFGSPKRQYLISPRIGRSGRGLAAIWSALEEASLSTPGKVQPIRGFPGPLRSPLYYLVGQNSHFVGQRSGLLPQARIGRSAPMGLLPSPRVGRRSDPMQRQLDSQEEFGAAPMSDTYLGDSFDSFVEG